MGGLCSEGHEFLRICKKRDPVKAAHLVDVLVTQHARWTARKLRRALFGQSLVDFSGEAWTSGTEPKVPSKISHRGKGKKKSQGTNIHESFTRQFEVREAGGGVSEVGSSVPPSSSLVQNGEFSTSEFSCESESLQSSENSSQELPQSISVSACLQVPSVS